MTGLAHLFEHLMFGGFLIFLITTLLCNWLEEKIMRSQVMISPIIILQFPQKILKLVFGWNPTEC
jgi:hypothetical protein